MFPKPEPQRRAKARAKRQQAKRTHLVRMYVFAREANRCRVCAQPATELHELRFRSLGGQISTRNSVACCHQCHSRLHRHDLIAVGADADSPRLTFRPR